MALGKKCKPKVSVVIPAYNVEKYIDKCIHSIEEQSLSDIEIIVVNDGSTDSTLEKVELRKKNNAKIIVIDKKNGGIVSARKAGVRAATADYIGFVDGDDWVDIGMYEIMCTIMDKYNVDMVSTSMNYYYSPDEVIRVNNWVHQGLYDKAKIRKEIYPKLIFGPKAFMASMGIKLFKKDLLKEIINNTDDSITYAEDVAIAYRYIVRCDSIYVIEDAYYYYRQHNNSVCHNKNNDVLKQIDKVIAAIRKEYTENVDSFLLNRYFNTLLRELLIYSYGILSVKAPKDFFFPYYNIEPGSLIVLYCAGRVGHSYYNQISRNHYCDIVLWVDKKYDLIDSPIVNAPSEIKNILYDYIVIALMDMEEIKKVKKELIEQYGIPKEKIIAKKAIGLDEVIRMSH